MATTGEEADQNPTSFAFRHFIHISRMRPMHLRVSTATHTTEWPDVFGNPSFHKRARCHDMDMYFQPCLDPRLGGQQGRLFILREGAVIGPGQNYRTYLKIGLYHKGGGTVNQQLVEGDFFGWGLCSSKDIQGFVTDGHLTLQRRPQNDKFSKEFPILLETDTGDTRDVGDTDPKVFPPTPPPTVVFQPRMGNWNPTDGKRNAWFRFVIDIPVGAVITHADIILLRAISQLNAVDVQIELVDLDDCPPFSETSGDAGFLTDLPTVPPAIPMSETILADNTPSWAKIETNLSELLQSFIDRPGYAVNNAIGIKVIGDLPANVLDDKFRSMSYEITGARMRVTWTDPAIAAVPASGPPALGGNAPFDKFNVGLGGAGSPESNQPDMLTADAYNYFWIVPVPNIDDWYDPAFHGTPPLYGPQAHNFPYPLNDCGTYPVPCITRTHPYRYVGLANNTRLIQPDLRATLGNQIGPPRPGKEGVYFIGCSPNDGQAQPLIENWIKSFHARTKTVRYHYDTDPESRGWWIEYTAYTKAWLVVDVDPSWNFTCTDPIQGGCLPGDDFCCVPRWNCWWEMTVIAKWNGDPTDDGFRNFVMSFESGFGSKTKPKTAHCNDIMCRCAGVPCALGDIIRPDPAVQDMCMGVGGTIPLCCVSTTGGYSWWYFPHASTHPASTDFAIPQWPETGLYHEFVRDVLEENGAVDHSDEGWLQIGFQTNFPLVQGTGILLPGGPGGLTNEIQTIIVTPNTAIGGSIFVDVAPPNVDLVVIDWFSTPAEVQASMEATGFYGPGDVVVTGTVGNYTFEFIAGGDVPDMSIFFQDLLGPDAPYTVTIAVTQQGTP